MDNKNSNEVSKFDKTAILHSALAVYIITTIAMIIAGAICCQNNMEKGSILINTGFIMSTLLSLSYLLVRSVRKMVGKEPESEKIDTINKKLDFVIEFINLLREQKQPIIS